MERMLSIGVGRHLTPGRLSQDDRAVFGRLKGRASLLMTLRMSTPFALLIGSFLVLLPLSTRTIGTRYSPFIVSTLFIDDRV